MQNNRTVTCCYCGATFRLRYLLVGHYPACAQKIRDDHASDVDGLMAELAERDQKIKRLESDIIARDTDTKALFLRIRLGEQKQEILLDDMQKKFESETKKLKAYNKLKIDMLLDQNDEDIKKLEKEHAKKDREYLTEIRKLTEEISKLNSVISNQVKLQEKTALDIDQKIDCLQAAVDKIQDKNTEIITDKFDKKTIRNEYYANMKPIDLSDKRHIGTFLSKLTRTKIGVSFEKITQVMVKHLLTGDRGYLVYCCTDADAKVFKYKDNNGKILTDNHGEMLLKVIAPALKRHFDNFYSNLSKNTPAFTRSMDTMYTETIKKKIMEYLPKLTMESADIEKYTRITRE